MNDEWEEVSHRHAGRWMLGALVAFVAATLLFGLWRDEEEPKPPESAAESVLRCPVDVANLDRRLEAAEATIMEARAYLRKHTDNP